MCIGGNGEEFDCPYRAVVRATILLLAAEGFGNEEISRRLRVTDDMVRKWRDRYAASGTLAPLDAIGETRE